MAKVGSARDHLRDVFPGELRELVPAAGLAADEQSEDERAVLLEEEHVTRFLFVDVPPEDAERRLVVGRLVDRRLGRRRSCLGGSRLLP